MGLVLKDREDRFSVYGASLAGATDHADRFGRLDDTRWFFLKGV